jgi:hypothetical protein
MKKASPDKDLSSYDLDKWLETAEYVLKRRDGRDILCYEILHRSLRELRWRRRVEFHLGNILSDIASSLVQTPAASTREKLGEAIDSAKAMATMPEKGSTKGKWNKQIAAELEKSKVFADINEKFLKPRGFVLTLQYEGMNESPTGASLEKYGDTSNGH